MKRLLSMAMLAVLVLSLGAVANASTYTFNPNPSDLNDLDHSFYYTWGFRLNVPQDQKITNAVLTITSIDNWANEADNELYIHLLDSPRVGTYERSDSKNGDQFAGQGVLVGTYHDSRSGRAETLTYDFNELGLTSYLNSYLANNQIAGFGFDPDCHYNNCGIKFTVTTAPVPEPSGLLAMLGGFSMAGISLFCRRK